MKGYDLYRDNVAMLFRHFDEYKTSARFFMAPLPFEVKYELFIGRRKSATILRPVASPIPLGALMLCWRQYPELFTVDTPSGKSMFFSFNGSPLSGSNCYSAVNLETGEITEGHDAPGFHKRCAALNAAVEQSRVLLKEYCGRNNTSPEEFVPASLEEVVDYVRCIDRR